MSTAIGYNGESYPEDIEKKGERDDNVITESTVGEGIEEPQ